MCFFCQNGHIFLLCSHSFWYFPSYFLLFKIFFILFYTFGEWVCEHSFYMCICVHVIYQKELNLTLSFKLIWQSYREISYTTCVCVHVCRSVCVYTWFYGSIPLGRKNLKRWFMFDWTLCVCVYEHSSLCIVYMAYFYIVVGGQSTFSSFVYIRPYASS